MSTGHSTDDWDLTWDDEVDDPRVETILTGLRTGYDFKPSDWKVQRITPIHRHPKARGDTDLAEEMFRGVPGGDSGKYVADKLVLEGDRLMDNYLTRKHDFELKEMESLRESYRQLLIKALTINQHYRSDVREEQIDEEETSQRTPTRKVPGASDAESLSTDSEHQLKRKNKGQRKKGKAKGKRVQADVGDESGDSDKKQKKKKPKQTIEGSGGRKQTDRVGMSISHIVEDVDRMYGQSGELEGGEPLSAENKAGETTELQKKVGEDKDQPVLVPQARDAEGENQRSEGYVTDAIMLDQDGLVVQETEEGFQHGGPGAGTDKDSEVPAIPTGELLPVVDPKTAPEVETESKVKGSDDPVIDNQIPENVDEGNEERGTAAAEEFVYQPKTSTDVGSTADAMDSQAGQTDSHLGATEELVDDQVDKNYCSGNEDDDLVDKSAPGSKDEEDVGGQDGAILALRSTRARHAPQRLGHTPEQKEKESEDDEEVYDPLRPVSERKKKLFYRALENRKNKEFKVLGHDVKKTFFRELYKPKQHVTTAHMEAMLACVWAKRGAEMLSNKVAVLDSWFCQYLVQEHGRYCKMKNQPIPFNWHPAIRNSVAGTVDNREGRLQWMVDVDNLYAPMNWGTNHWVALNINLVNGTVTILDCNHDLTPEPKIPRLMKPVADVLALIVRDLVDAALEPADSFDFVRAVGVTQNGRAGDCGPLTVKFIELDAQGHSLDGISDDQVDELRLRYAVDVYEGNDNRF